MDVEKAKAGEDASRNRSSEHDPRAKEETEIPERAQSPETELDEYDGLGQTLSILHIIGDHFGVTNPGVLSWLIAGYSLTVGTFILFTGRLGDLFGWKKMLVIGYVWYAVWSMVAGLSWYSNHVLFVFARVFQGIGPAICLPNLTTTHCSFPLSVCQLPGLCAE